ncbi:MAG: hypothetical protein N2203_06990 [Bacteroidia bacterium]|nr:hypothetical protein [Bacteroidia bacterium]
MFFFYDKLPETKDKNTDTSNNIRDTKTLEHICDLNDLSHVLKCLIII